jgi:hypothetical protein
MWIQRVCVIMQVSGGQYASEKILIRSTCKLYRQSQGPWQLSPNLGDGLSGSGGGGLGLRGGGVGGDFDPVGEPDTLNELGQLVVAIEPAPAFLRRIDQLEHHGERRLRQN